MNSVAEMADTQAAELEMPREYSDHILCKQVLWAELESSETTLRHTLVEQELM